MKGLNPVIIAIDDEEINLLLFQELGREAGIDIRGFSSAREAVEFVKHNHVDIALVDYMMPEMDGLKVIDIIHRQDPSIIIIMITAIGESREIKLRAFELGATEFLTKPLDSVEFQMRLKNLIYLRQAHNILQNFNSVLKQEVKRATRELRMRELETITVLSRAAEFKDYETGNHILRVAHYSVLIAKKYGLSKREQDILFFSSPLHDVGKVGIPDNILTKPGRLTKEEFEIIKTHTTIGYAIMNECRNNYLQKGAEIALAHHEKFDGSGYPKGLQGEDIPFRGRIVAIADVFDALTTTRPYKEAWPLSRAFDLISRERGRHFDPELARVFLDSSGEVEEIFNKFSNENKGPQLISLDGD